jgi:23S rRNA-intervening sequence protein
VISDQGPAWKGFYRTVFSRVACLAKIDPDDRCNLPPHWEVSPRRGLRTNQPTPADRGLYSKQHSGGTGRLSTGEYRQFLGIARGSNFEVQTQLEFARALGLGDSDLIDKAESLSHEVGKMIYAILESTKE